MHTQIRKTFGSILLSIVASSILCPPLDQCHDWTEQGDAAPFEYEAGAACHDWTEQGDAAPLEDAAGAARPCSLSARRGGCEGPCSRMCGRRVAGAWAEGAAPPCTLYAYAY